jgi:hypothetical protein
MDFHSFTKKKTNEKEIYKFFLEIISKNSKKQIYQKRLRRKYFPGGGNTDFLLSKKTKLQYII